MKYCLIFYFYLAVATKDYTRHHKVGYSLDVDDDFSKIAVDIYRALLAGASNTLLICSRLHNEIDQLFLNAFLYFQNIFRK